MRFWFGIILVSAAVLSVLADWNGYRIPTVSWGYNLTRSAGELNLPWLFDGMVKNCGLLTAIGWGGLGIYLIWKAVHSGPPNPITLRKIRRFKSIKRGYYSFIIILFLAGLAALDQAVVGKEALAVRCDGKWSFPAFSVKLEKNRDYGIEDGTKDLEPNYRDLKKHFEGTGNRVILPLWPYGATQDSIDALARNINFEEYDGLGTRLFNSTIPEKPHLRYTYRNGKREGAAQGWNKSGDRVFKANYKEGELVNGSVEWTGKGELEDFLALSDETEFDVSYPPSEPKLSHPLGTNSDGYDVVAYLYGGMQVNFQAALIYIPIVYLIGISVGLLMGYFGGWFDLIAQRLIEILSNIPFLFVVIVIGMTVPAQWKDRLGLYLILGILAMFGWMGMTYLLRTSALKEKARDYIAASRVIGASTPRILFRHLMPNSVAILVTLIPFSVSGLILSLTALDYLGFGLPVQYASWGKLLQDGLSQLSSPWLVTSAFVCLVTLLVLVTFVGEAIREAFDPKKHTYYR